MYRGLFIELSPILCPIQEWPLLIISESSWHRRKLCSVFLSSHYSMHFLLAGLCHRLSMSTARPPRCWGASNGWFVALSHSCHEHLAQRRARWERWPKRSRLCPRAPAHTHGWQPWAQAGPTSSISQQSPESTWRQIQHLLLLEKLLLPL